jgi:hypothetical protein
LITNGIIDVTFAQGTDPVSSFQLLNAGFPKQDGTDVSGVKDSTGRPIVMDTIRMVQAEHAGWMNYMWPKAGQTKPLQKWSYVKAVSIDGKPAYVQKMDLWGKNKKGEPFYKGKGDYQDKEGMTLTEGVRQYNQCALAIDEGVIPDLRRDEDALEPGERVGDDDVAEWVASSRLRRWAWPRVWHFCLLVSRCLLRGWECGSRSSCPVVATGVSLALSRRVVRSRRSCFPIRRTGE